MKEGILIVSGDPEFCRAVDVSLRLMEYETMLASSVLEALELANSSRPKVLVADLSIHRRCDGLELAGELQRRLPQLRCVITGDCDSSGHSASTETCAWLQTIKRPFSMIQFIGVVDAAVHHTSRQRREYAQRSNAIPTVC